FTYGCVVERLDAEPVAPKDQLLPPAVPESEGEHAPQRMDPSLAILLVQMDDHLDVAPCPEAVSFRLQEAPQLSERIDLAVRDELNRSVFIRDRLLSRFHVDDAEAPHPEGDSVPEVVALPVGTP